MPAFIWLRRTRFSIKPRWTRAEMPTPSPFARAPFLCSEDSQANKDCARWKNTTLGRTSGLKSHQWRTRDTTWVPVPSETNAFTLSVDSSEAQSKKSTTVLSFMKLRRICGKSSPSEWRIHFGLAALWLSPQMKSYSSVVRTRTGMARFTYSM